jgi:hypothetical protein
MTQLLSTDLDDQVVAMIAGRGQPVRSLEITQHFALTPARAWRRLHALAERGAIRKVNRGMWALPGMARPRGAGRRGRELRTSILIRLRCWRSRQELAQLASDRPLLDRALSELVDDGVVLRSRAPAPDGHLYILSSPRRRRITKRIATSEAARLLPPAPAVLTVRDVSAALNCRKLYAREVMTRLVTAGLADTIALPDKFVLYRMRSDEGGEDWAGALPINLPAGLAQALRLFAGGQALGVEDLASELGERLELERHLQRLLRAELLHEAAGRYCLSDKGGQLLAWLSAAQPQAAVA